MEIVEDLRVNGILFSFKALDKLVSYNIILRRVSSVLPIFKKQITNVYNSKLKM